MFPFFFIDHKEHPLYVTQRYDRKVGKDVMRIHQQDFCQAQGVISEHKINMKLTADQL
jgi:serine/threonine-protein kinase HipA